MTRWIGGASLVLALAGPVGAGEIVFRNGARLVGELASEVLMFSTGAAVVEIDAEQVALLTRDEIRLADGRVIRGTLVGSSLKVRTALGELAVKLDELEFFRADRPVAQTAVAPDTPPGATVTPSAPAAPDATRAQGGVGQVVDGARKIGQGFEETAKGLGRAVVDGADRLHDGAKALGVAIRDAARSVGRAFQSLFSGS